MACIDRWHSIRLTDHTVIDHLNAYLSSGWYLEHFDLDGLPYPIFSVPTELVPPGERRIEEMLELRTEGKEAITVMVLRNGTNGFRQKAVLLEQNSDGKFVQTVPQEGWKSMATLRLENGEMFGVYQRGET